MRLKKLAIPALILLVPSLAAAILFTQNRQVGDKVVEIIDGDTFKLENKQLILLDGLDAPELKYCLGQEAKEALSKLILGKRVVLLDPYADKFGRVIALVLCDGQIVNEIMIRNGYALGTHESVIAKKAFEDANNYARAHNLGIFNEKCSQVVPPDINCFIKGNHDQREGRPLYSYPGCTNYNRTVVNLWQGDQWFCSEADALKAGYSRSGDCQSKLK